MIFFQEVLKYALITTEITLIQPVGIYTFFRFNSSSFVKRRLISLPGYERVNGAKKP